MKNNKNNIVESEYDPLLMGALGTVAGLGVAAAGLGVKKLFDKRKERRQAESDAAQQEALRQQQAAQEQAAAQAAAEAEARRAARAKPKSPEEIMARAQQKALGATTPAAQEKILRKAQADAQAFVETQRRSSMVPGEGHATIPFTPIELTKSQVNALGSHALSQRTGLIELVSRIPENHPNRRIFMDAIERVWPDHPQHGYLPHSHETSLQSRYNLYNGMMERIRREHPELLKESVLVEKYGRTSSMLEILEMFERNLK